MAEFLAMGGYAEFVWSAFALWLVCMVFNIVSARRKIRASLESATVAAARQRARAARKMKPENDP